jgi:hypothetical protein
MFLNNLIELPSIVPNNVPLPGLLVPMRSFQPPRILLQGGAFACEPVVTNVQPRALSLGGGVVVTVMLQGGGGSLQGSDEVSVVLGAGPLGPSGLPCASVTAASSSLLSCTAPPLTGLVLTELWAVTEAIPYDSTAVLQLVASSRPQGERPRPR